MMTMTPFTPSSISPRQRQRQQRPITFGIQRGSSQACSRSIRIQYMPQSRKQEREERESLEAMQFQYEMATWKMQDRILRYRENKASSACDGSTVATIDTTDTIIAYYDDDDDDDDAASDNDSCSPRPAQSKGETNYEHFEIFQMDL